MRQPYWIRQHFVGFPEFSVNPQVHSATDRSTILPRRLTQFPIGWAVGKPTMRYFPLCQTST